MREIKFRAFYKPKKIMCDVIQVDFGADNYYLVNPKNKREDFLCTYDKIELMQFTGFYGKNSNEIYEDDIVKLPAGNMRVSFSDGAFVLIPPKTNVIYEALGLIEDEYEIIGNIHDNPELLEK